MYLQNITDALYSVVTATIFFEKDQNGHRHTFGSVEQAEQYVQDYIKSYDKSGDKYWGEVIGHVVEDLCYIPCDANNPDGMLYQSPRYTNYVDLEGIVSRQ